MLVSKERDNSERGVIAILFAFLISSGLLIALFVIVVDTSSVFIERRTVQNAADSASLALAQACALGESSCSSLATAKNYAGGYANANSEDFLTNIASDTCVNGNTLACPSRSPRNSLDCQTVSSDYRNYVRVATDTQTATSNSLRLTFLSILDGNSERDIQGCANTAWGKASFAPVFLPVGLPICDRNGVSYLSKLNDSQGVLIEEFARNGSTTNRSTVCSFTDLDGNPHTITGITDGFALLRDFGCPQLLENKTSVSIGTIYPVETSLQQVESGSGNCSNSNQFYTNLDKLKNRILFLPIFSQILCQTGANTYVSIAEVNCGQGNYRFRVEGFFAFEYIGSRFQLVTGLGPNAGGSWPSNCTSSKLCLYGKYKKSIVPGSTVSTDPNVPGVGALAVQLLP